MNLLKLFPNLFSSLYARLALAFVSLFCVLGLAFLLLTNWSNNRYYQEVTQNLNNSLAMYIVQRAPLIQNGEVNKAVVKELANLVMVVNPIVEVYVLDNTGNILAHALPQDTIVRSQIDLTPIKQWLASSAQNAALKAQGENVSAIPLITAQDPRSANSQRVFSAFPITDNNVTAGYLYVVLGGQAYQSLSEALASSYILKQSLTGLAAIIIFACLCAALIFAVLTRPLRQLAWRVNNFQQNQLPSTLIAPHQDEIRYLTHAFAAMEERIQTQLQELENTDRLRRELISNVSHDLRTPLSSMQGYLEMLLKPEITADERARFIAIAFKHCQQLTRLVKELFELSKLDAGRTLPQKENFSLAELLQDVTQKFSLQAKEKNIQLFTPQNSAAFNVHADIALIERVLENLIDNALRYTPNGGRIKLQLSQLSNKVEVRIADTGIGLAAEDLPFIFERYYCATKPHAYNQNSTGLGLAIVKRILELHQSPITVESELTRGSVFSFQLAADLPKLALNHHEAQQYLH